MFEAGKIDPVAYEDPWNASFDERLVALTARPRHIAYFCKRPDASTFRYRVFNMVKSLTALPQVDTSASWFHNLDLPNMDRFIDRADALVICRARYSASIERMIARAKARGIPVIYDVDDFVFDPAHVRLVMETLDRDADSPKQLDRWFAMFARYGTTLRMCDRVLVTNAFLAKLAQDFAPHLTVGIIPNFLNDQQQHLSMKLYRAKQESRFRSDGRIHLGYFSGTSTHNRDFAVVAPVLSRLLDEDPRLVLRVVGLLDTTVDLFKHHNDRVEIHPLQDFLNLQRLIAEVEVNIAPLQPNIFTECKSELKFFEAAIVGTVTIASPTFTFRQAVTDGKNSFLAGSHEWERKLREVVKLVEEPEQYAAIAECGYGFAKRAYGWDKFGKAIEEAVFYDYKPHVSHAKDFSNPSSAGIGTEAIERLVDSSPIAMSACLK